MGVEDASGEDGGGRVVMVGASTGMNETVFPDVRTMV